MNCGCHYGECHVCETCGQAHCSIGALAHVELARLMSDFVEDAYVAVVSNLSPTAAKPENPMTDSG